MNRTMLLAAAALLALPGAALAERCPGPETYHAPQPELPKERLVIVGRDGREHAFSVEMALTGEQQEIGEMARPTVPADGGMLFDLGVPEERARFWMCNTPASLDMVFIRADGTVVRVAADTEPLSTRVISSGEPVLSVLELNAGTAAKLGIRAGDKVEHPLFRAR